VEGQVTVGGDGARTKESQVSTRPLFCDPPDKARELAGMFRRIQTIRNHALFVLVSEMIDDDIYQEVYRWRKELKVAGAEGQLDVLLHSPGGTLNPCYQTARFLARHSNDWQALVPAYAASGATMICLGSSEIAMSDMAYLSPIDPQVISKRRERFFMAERQSPLEAFQAMKYLREFSLESLDAGMMFLLERQVAPHLALETATRFAMQIVHPVLAKVEPYDLGSFARDSDLAVKYCQQISNPSDSRKRTQRDVKYPALVLGYPAHEFIIDTDEAEELGFKLCAATDKLDEAYEELRDKLEGVKTCIGVIGGEEEPSDEEVCT